ncbi:hypothetical protein J6590_030983 [Homalodisca vitripennis]|nr:hypothetical protein J6590_030983 [Homalodisca vitripennis]
MHRTVPLQFGNNMLTVRKFAAVCLKETFNRYTTNWNRSPGQDAVKEAALASGARGPGGGSSILRTATFDSSALFLYEQSKVPGPILCTPERSIKMSSWRRVGILVALRKVWQWF